MAAIAKSAGHRVTGCDANVYPPMSTQLEEQGIDLIQGFDASQIGIAPDLYVIGNVVTRGNPLMEEILNRNLRFVSGPQWLAEHVLGERWVLAVAGTHGKTTTSSMLAWILEHAGLKPGFLIGGVPRNFGISARLGEAPFFVIEADEYDTAFFDKRSKFLHYGSRTTVLNNLEFDHADIFPDLAAIETQFHHFVRTLAANGLLVVNGGDQALERVLKRGCWTLLEKFGVAEGWCARGIDADSFEVHYADKREGVVKWKLAGAHNELNALAALGCFENVKRRLEMRGSANGITVYDDFAHHPTAIRVTLDALRSKVNGERIIAVLEPRSNTMKLGVMKKELAASLALAEHVFCYTAGLGWDAGGALQLLGDKAESHADFERLLDAIAKAARPGDHVLIMSNGGFNGIHDKLLRRLGGASGR